MNTFRSKSIRFATALGLCLTSLTEPLRAAQELLVDNQGDLETLFFMDIPVVTASKFQQTDVVIMGIVLIGVIGFGIDLLMRVMERRLVPWKGRA